MTSPAAQPPVVIYDACVLYGDQLRHLLIELASVGIVRAHWTAEIADEWTRNLKERRPDLALRIDRTRTLMEAAVRDALVTGYQRHEAELTRTAKSDRHVVAAAIEAKASVIVTANVRHFPEEELKSYNLTAQHPDGFLVDQIVRNAVGVGTAVRRHRERLARPAMSVNAYLDSLRLAGVPRTADSLAKRAGAI